MDINLEKIGMHRGQQYETIITTTNQKNEINSAPFGVFCKGKDKIMCRIFKGSTSLENIINKREFIVNITENPLMFTLATINTIPKDYLSYLSPEIAIIKETDAYFKCEVESIKKAIKHDDPVKKSKTYVINSNVTELKINNSCAKAINRGIHLLIESLANYSRLDLVDSDKQKYYQNRLNEAERVIRKLGSKEEKEAIEILKKEFKK